MVGTFRQLEIFARVCELGSMGRAAEVLQISQAGVSQQISALEQAVGQALLKRSVGRPNLPTPAGLAFWDYAKKVLEDQRKLLAALPGRKKIIRIGAESTIVNLIFNRGNIENIQFLNAVDIEYAVCEVNDSCVDLIEGEKLDALYFTSSDQGEIHLGAQRISQMSSGLFATKGIFERSQKGRIDVLIPRPNERVFEGLRDIIRNNISTEYKITTCDIKEFFELVLQGVGAGFMNRSRAKPYVEAGLLHELSGSFRPVNTARYRYLRQDIDGECFSAIQVHDDLVKGWLK